MKSILIIASLIAISLNIEAQPPQGGRPGGGRPPMGEMRHGPGNNDDKIGIRKLPEIPNLTNDQREKLVKYLTDERQNVIKLMNEKRDLSDQYKNKSDLSQKEIDKKEKKIAEINEKIEKVKNKSNEKISTLLTPEQYLVFGEKKKEIEFTGREKMRNRPPHGESGQRPEFSEREMPPQMPEDGEF